MAAPILFGRRMKLVYHDGGQTVSRSKWLLRRGPFEFCIYCDGYTGSFNAFVTVGGECVAEQNRTTIEGALRSLTAMRSRLVRQLQDKK